MNREQRPTSMALDDRGNLVTHDPFGVRVWSFHGTAGPTPSTSLPLPPVSIPLRGAPPLARTPDGRMMVLVRSPDSRRPSAVLLWHSQTPALVQPVTPPPSSLGESASTAQTDLRGNATNGTDAEGLRFRSVQIAPHGQRLYLLDEKFALHLWNLEATSRGYQAHEVAVRSTLPEGINSLALRPDGAVLALGDRTGAVSFFDTRRLTVTDRIHPASDQTEGFVTALAFAPDGRDLAVGTLEGRILIWPATTPHPKEPRLSLPGHHGLVSSLVFDAQGRRLASAVRNDPLVEVWDLELIQRELTRLGLAD
jgi:WD40 repeat protein